MRAVWSDQHKYELWLRIEILACEAWAELGRIPKPALPKIRKGSFDAARIAELEARVGHDVIAFLTVLNFVGHSRHDARPPDDGSDENYCRRFKRAAEDDCKARAPI